MLSPCMMLACQISMNVCCMAAYLSRPGLRLENPQFLRSRVSPVCVCGWYDCNGCDVWLFDGCQPEPMHHLQSKRNISHSDTTPLDWTIKHMNVVECFKTHSSKIYFTTKNTQFSSSLAQSGHLVTVGLVSGPHLPHRQPQGEHLTVNR